MQDMTSIQPKPPLPCPVPPPAPGFRVFDVTSPSQVEAAAQTQGPIHWICPAPPTRVLGALAADFQGAWIEEDTACCNAGPRGLIRVSLPTEIHPADHASFLAGLLDLCLRNAPLPTTGSGHARPTPAVFHFPA